MFHLLPRSMLKEKKKKKILAGYTLSGTAVSLETIAISSLIIQGPNGN